MQSTEIFIKRPGVAIVTEREQEFLQHACSELTYREIAKKMNCSPRTVENYRVQLMDKLNIRTRTGLVIFAIKNKIAQI
jgi:DNA-binding NarL/FixJ family response regulator